MKRIRLAFFFLGQALLLIAPAGGRAAEDTPVRVAVLNFQDEGNHWKDYEFGRELATFFTAEIAGLEGIELVERSEDSVLWDEFAITPFMAGNNAKKAGNWLDADLIVRGRFSGHFGNDLQLEVIDAANADILASHQFKGSASWGSIESAQFEFRKEFGETPVRLLKEAIARKKALRDEVRIAPLFFKNASSNRRLDHYEEMIFNWIPEQFDRIPGVTPLRFGGFSEALEEQTLSLLGFTQADPDRWKRVADYFIWATFDEVRTGKAIPLENLEVNIQFHWLARNGQEGNIQIRTVRLDELDNGFRGALAAFFKDQATGGVLKIRETEGNHRDVARRISDQLFEQAGPMLPRDAIEGLGLKVKSRSSSPYVNHLVQAACLFDPGDVRKEFARLHLRKRRPENPLICARYAADRLNWVAKVTAEPPEAFSTKGLAHLLTETWWLMDQKWGLPVGYRPVWMREHPVSPLHEREFLERFVTTTERAMGFINRQLAERSLYDRHQLTRFFQSGISDVARVRYLDPDHRRRLVAAYWSIHSRDRDRETYAEAAFNDLLKLEQELGHEPLVEILNGPLPPDVKTDTKSPPRPEPTSPAASKQPATPKQTQYYRVRSDRLLVKAPEPIRLRKPALTVLGGYYGHGFVPEDIWRAGSTQYLVTGSLQPRRTGPYGAPASTSSVPHEKLFTLVVDLNMPAIGVPNQDKFVGRSRLRVSSRDEMPPPEVFAEKRATAWSSDGKWAAGWRYLSPSKTTGGPSGHRLFRWEKESGSVRDLSPRDGELVLNTRNGIALVEDRWLYLIGRDDRVVRFNVLDLDTGTPDWRSFECRLPDSGLPEQFSTRIPGDQFLTTCGRWLLLSSKNGLSLLEHGETELQSANHLADALIEMEREARRADFSGEAEVSTSRLPNYLGSPAIANPARLAEALEKVPVSLHRVLGDHSGFWLLSSSGVTPFDPNTGKIGLHVRHHPATLVDSPRGPRWDATVESVPSDFVLSKDHCLVAERRQSKHRLNVIERASGTHLGAVRLEHVEPRQLVAQGENCFVFGALQGSLSHPSDMLRPVTGYSIPDLVGRLRSPDGFQITTKPRSPPSARPRNSATAPSRRGNRTSIAIADGDLEELDRLILDPVFHRETIRYRSVIAAVESGKPEILRKLLEAGADPNATLGSIGNGWETRSHRFAPEPTPLMRAAALGNRPICDLLIEYGAYAPLKDVLFRNAVDHAAADDEFQQWLSTRCEPQFRLEALFPALRVYLWKAYDWHVRKEEAEPIIVDALRKEPSLLHIPMEDGKTLFRKMLRQEGYKGDAGKTIFVKLSGFNPNATDRFGRNFLAQERAPENRGNHSDFTNRLALELGCDPRLEDRFGKSALDYVEDDIAREIEKKGSIDPDHYLVRFRDAFLEAPGNP